MHKPLPPSYQGLVGYHKRCSSNGGLSVHAACTTQQHSAWPPVGLLHVFSSSTLCQATCVLHACTEQHCSARSVACSLHALSSSTLPFLPAASQRSLLPTLSAGFLHCKPNMLHQHVSKGTLGATGCTLQAL